MSMASEAEAASPPPNSRQPRPEPGEQEPPRHLYALPAEEPDESPEVDETAESTEEFVDTSGPRVEWMAVWDWAREAFSPDSGLYSDRPESVREIVDRAKRGTQVAEHGPLRKISVAHGYLAAANKVTLRSWEWVLDRQARTCVAVVLLVLLVAIPQIRHLIAYLLYPLVWVQQLLLG